MSDSKPSPVAPPSPALASGAAKPATPPSVAGGAPQPNPFAPPAAVGSPALFGGHRGGGKRRADGLVAGSEEAKAADREKDRQRKQAARVASKGTPLPPPLSATAPVSTPPLASAAVPVAGGPSLVPMAPASAGGAVAPWDARLLKKPCELIARIGERVRLASYEKRLAHPKLPAELRAEFAKDLPLPPAALADFSTALADCAAVELNKRGVGAGQSHWLALTASVVELGTHHVQTMERLDKLIAKLDEEKTEARSQKPECQKEGAK